MGTCAFLCRDDNGAGKTESIALVNVLDSEPMKHLPLIIAVIALLVAILAWDQAHTALKRIEDFGLRPHPAADSRNPAPR